MNVRKLFKGPAWWGSLTLIIAQAVSLAVASRGKSYVIENQITIPEVSSPGIPIIYFFFSLAFISLVLLLVPASWLKIVFRLLFMLLFSWGLFIVLVFWLPELVAVAIALAGGLVWFFSPRVWWHNLLLIFSLAAMGAVFGLIFPPWVALVLMLVISVYDILAVRLGFMMWLVKRMSGGDALPAFVIPKSSPRWGQNLRGMQISEEQSEREFSLLGGGDIGFPLLLVDSVLIASGLAGALVVSAFSILGLLGAYWFQTRFLKGKPMPAMPPITLACLVGYLIVRFVM